MVEEAIGPQADEAPPIPQPTQFIARQPILNARREIVAYELLSRAGWENWFRGERGEATRRTLDQCVFMGIDSLTHHQLAFVNCTREILLSRWVTLLPPQTTVLEILETVAPDTELVETCIELRKMGYKLALDDLVPRPEMQPLIDLASYVKVDFRLQDAERRRAIHTMVRGSHAALLAEKVEDQEQFNTARAEGYEYFQGYFFGKPTVTANREIPASRINYLRLLVALTRDPLNLNEVSEIVKMEASLCYRLLRLANSPLWGRRSDVTSVLDAFMLVGENRFRMLVSVAASCEMGENQAPALTVQSLERARFCELLAPVIGEKPSEQFMLGLFSLLEAMLGIPMATIMQTLPLRREVKAALQGATNQVSVPLCMIKNFELGLWEPCVGTARTLDIKEETLTRLYIEAVQWASEAFESSR
ncbi:MAG: HDOD domain-containing protein [Acidobacteriaceae bacterium]|jgi:EAL and modified HD-GYP domain-containing signal transduction protein